MPTHGIVQFEIFARLRGLALHHFRRHAQRGLDGVADRDEHAVLRGSDDGEMELEIFVSGRAYVRGTMLGRVAVSARQFQVAALDDLEGLFLAVARGEKARTWLE